MAPQKMWLNVFATVKTIWQKSWQSLWQGEKRMLPVVIAGYGAILVLMAAMFFYVALTSQTGKPFSLQEVSAHTVDIIIGAILFLLVGNFVLAALIARAYAWINNDHAFAAKTWHIAHRTFLKLFAIHLAVLVVDVGLQMLIVNLAQHTPQIIHIIIAFLGFFLYMTVLAIPFVTYTGIVGESMPFRKTCNQGIKLLFSNWGYVISVMILSIFLPTMIVFSLMHIPVINNIVALFILFVYYPFLLVVISFTNISIYTNAKKLYQAKMANKGIDIKQA